MAVETYTVQYVADVTSFTTGARQVEAALLAVDAAATKSKASLKGFAGGAARSAANSAKKVDQLTASLNGVPAAANSAKASLSGITIVSQNANKAVGGLGSGLAGLVGSAVAIRTVTGIVDDLSKALAEARKHLNDGAEKGLRMRDDAREYANLLGKNGPDDATMGRLLGVAQAGGMGYGEALKYGEQFMGSLPAGKQKNHVTDDQAAKLETEGAAFGTRIGLDPATAGDLAGVIPQYVDLTKDARGNALVDRDGKDKGGVDKGLGQLGALAYGLNEGRGKISTLARSELGAAAGALAAGHVTDHAEMGAFAGVASTFSKTASSSGTAFKQMDRLVNESLGDEGEWLKTIGVADQKGDLAKLEVLKKHIDAQRAAAPDPAKFDAKALLQSKGFRENGELDSTLAFLDNLDVLKKRTVEARRRAGDGASVRKANEAFAVGLTGQDRGGRATEEAGTYIQTQGRQRLAAARKTASGQLQAENKVDNWWTNFVDKVQDKTVGMIGYNNKESFTSREARLDERVWENFHQATKKAGLDEQIEAKYPGYKIGFTGRGGLKLDQALNEYGPEFEKRGISINGPNAGINSQIDALKKTPSTEAGAAAGAAPGNAAAAAVPGGPKVAAGDTSKLDKAGEKLDRVADALMVAARNLNNGRPSPGSGLGGAYGPYRA